MNSVQKIGKFYFTNLTGHVVKELSSGLEIGPAKSKDILRVKMFSPQVMSIEEIKLFGTIFEIKNIPKFQENNFYIVSQKVADTIAMQYPKRKDFVCTARIEHRQKKFDLLSPSGEPVYDKNGNKIKIERLIIVGTHGFSFSKFLNLKDIIEKIDDC